MKKPSKPNYHFFRPANFLVETQGMSNAAVGALMRLSAHAWQQWQPDVRPFPSLPNDEAVLARLCGNGRSWQQVREQVIAKLSLEDGWYFYAPQREDAENVRNYQTLKAEQKAKKAEERAAKPAKGKKEKPQPAARQPAKPTQEELQAAAIRAANQPPAPPEPEPQRPWDEAPAPEKGKFVQGLQGHRIVGVDDFNRLLRHSAKLKEAECILWNVTDAGVKQHQVKVFRQRGGFALLMPNGQTITDD
jgi:hypothetical protein